jgi:hypothetical protein
MLNAIGYDGPLSVEWEDAGMDRMVGAPEALRFVKDHAFDPPAAAFGAAFTVRSGNSRPLSRTDGGVLSPVTSCGTIGAIAGGE